MPNLANPQALNRFSYTGNNPVRFNDPTGHAWDDCGERSGYQCQIHMNHVNRVLSGGNDRGRGRGLDAEYACVDGWGCFDLNHLRSFGYPGSNRQADFWYDFQNAADLGEGFPIRLSNGTNFGSSLAITYFVSGNLSSTQYRGVAMAIFQDFAREFEEFQLLISNFANQDLPSDYLGLLAAMEGYEKPESILSELGGKVIFVPEATPGMSIRPNDASNYEFTPRVPGNGGYVNKPWPQALVVDPINDPKLWSRQTYAATYGWGTFRTEVTYGPDGARLWCTLCGGVWSK